MSDYNGYESKYNKKPEGESLLSEESRAKAASLLDFINSVKESSAFLKEDAPKAELPAEPDKSKDVISESTEVSEDKEPQKKEKAITSSKEVTKPEEVSPVLEVAEKTTAEQEKASEETAIEEEFCADKEQVVAAIKAEMAEDGLIVDGEDAFNKGFNPAFAFYDDKPFSPVSVPAQDIEKSQIISDTKEVKVKAEDTAEIKSEFPASNSDSPKTFERVGAKQQPQVVEIKKPEKKKQDKKFSFSFKKDKKKTLVKKENKKQEAEKAVKEQSAKVTKDKPAKAKAIKKLLPKQLAAAVVAAVVLLTAGIMAVKGLYTVFATDDIYGIFVEGRLVAASNQEGKIEEAIDDFLSYYKVLEEQGSLSNLRFTGSYEIRQLTREEIKAGIYTAKNTTKATTASTTQTTNAGSDTTAVTDQTTAQTTVQTTEATTVQTDANGNTTHATTNQSNPINKEGDKLIISQNVDELKNVLFYGEAPKIYTVVEGDNLYKIAKRENLTLTELMVPNPDLLEDSTIGIDQEIRIVKMSGPLKLSFSREVTVTEDIAYETVEEKTDELYEGEKKTVQEGKEGIRQEVTKYDYENNVIAVKTPVSNETLEEPTKKIVKVGTKPKTSADQSSGLADSGSSSSSSSGFIYPVNGARLTSKFGPRKAPKKGASTYHRGIDLAISSGTPIYATKSGTVTIASYVGGYGNLVELNHGGGYTSRYGHCSKLAVKRGQKVNQGDVIAYVGNTGVSTGPHLHFEIRKGGTAVNPLNYLSAQ